MNSLLNFEYKYLVFKNLNSLNCFQENFFDGKFYWSYKPDADVKTLPLTFSWRFSEFQEQVFGLENV